jgi:hypothetical protein
MYQLLTKILDEATVSDIKRKQQSITKLFPTFPDRVRRVEDLGGLRLKRIDDDNWYFKIHSGTKTDVWYDAVVHFKNITQILSKLVKDRRLWVTDGSRVDLQQLARAFANNIDVQTFCSCPADLYWGGHYIRSLGKYDAKYTKPELRSPRNRNPRQYGAYCKHTAALVKALPFYTTTIARWLKDFYSKDIAKFEKQAKREFVSVKRAAKELGVRKKETEKGIKSSEEQKPIIKGKEVTKPVSTEKSKTTENRLNEVQGIGYFMIDGEKIKVLWRDTKTTRYFKIRKGGSDGTHFTDEEIHFRDNPNRVQDLKDGEVIAL